jgi:hypothetical protein
VADGPTWAFLAFLACGFWLIGIRVWSDRNERGRATLRQVYTNGFLIFPFRQAVAIGPLWGVAAILMGAGIALPKLVGAWLWVPALVLFTAGFLLAYRVPPPFRPRWMREEQEDGRLDLARPDKMDWVLFWIVLPFALLGPVAIVLLIVVYDSVQP